MIRRALGIVALVFAFAQAHAQAPAPPPNTNAQASELATRLGREQSAEGLETILRSRNVDLMAAYDRGFRATGMRLYTERGNKAAPMPAGVEAVMVRYYADPVMGGRLPGLCVGTACQTRELFDLMLAELRTGKFRGSDYDLREATVRSEASGVEAALTAWLDAADAPTSYNFNAVVQVLGRRKYAGAVPALAARLAKGDPAQASTVENALVEIATPAAIDALLARMAALKASPAPTAAQQSKSLADRLAQVGPEIPIPYERLRATLPPDTRQYAIGWLMKRKDLKAVPDALVLLGERATFSSALDALVASDSPEVWQQARAEVERLKKEGKLEDYQYRSASTSLDGKIADPAKHMAERARAEREREFSARRALLSNDKAAAWKLRDSNPEGYTAAMREYLKAAEKLAAEYSTLTTAVGARSDLATDYQELGHFLRFRLKRPKEAIEAYAGAHRAGQWFGGLGVADTYQFDLRDRERALVEYRKAPAQRTSAFPSDQAATEAMDAWGRRWLAAQEAYLSRGEKFSGAIGENDLGIAALFGMYGAGVGGTGDAFELGPLHEAMGRARNGGKVDRAEVKRVLDKAPPSAFVLMQTLPLISYLPDAASILAFLERHDPAGFATACYFGLVEIAERRGGDAGILVPGMQPAEAKDPLREAKVRFVRDRRIDLGEVTKPPDARMSSPKGTWDLFLSSMRKGDLQTAMSCLTPQMQSRFRPLFSGMSPADLRASADTFTGFHLTTAYGEFQEAMVSRSDGKAGVVTFVNSGGTWKIGEM